MDEAKQRKMLELFGEFRAEKEAAPSWLNIETGRLTGNADLFEAMIREAFDDVTLVVAGHHIMFMRKGAQVPVEIASADTLIFDHTVAAKIWGKERFPEILSMLAAEPVATRDSMLRGLFDVQRRME